jgi:hypothetical protein
MLQANQVRLFKSDASVRNKAWKKMRPFVRRAIGLVENYAQQGISVFSKAWCRLQDSNLRPHHYELGNQG